MFKRMVKGQMMLAIILGSVVLLGQRLPQSSSSSAGTEFPNFYEAKHRRR
jgi:hypothetical protein